MAERGLSRQGFHLRERLAEMGVEVTPDQLEDSIDEALQRVRPGPDGKCVKCGNTHRTRGPGKGTPLDFRFGLCDECAFPDETTPNTGTNVPNEEA